jgi:hypothetical protein
MKPIIMQTLVSEHTKGPYTQRDNRHWKSRDQLGHRKRIIGFVFYGYGAIAANLSVQLPLWTHWTVRIEAKLISKSYRQNLDSKIYDSLQFCGICVTVVAERIPTRPANIFRGGALDLARCIAEGLDFAGADEEAT